MQGHNDVKVRKIGNTDLKFSIGIDLILKPLYSDRRRGDRIINQVTYFNFAEMLWTSVEHEARGPAAEGRVLNLIAFEINCITFVYQQKLMS